ncbi:MAG: hypothetical protein ONB49_21230, partial [candidate division KSB1 bacterium]|nr:hypothetical protein [candidate division KSB1 bacterium]
GTLLEAPDAAVNPHYEHGVAGFTELAPNAFLIVEGLPLPRSSLHFLAPFIPLVPRPQSTAE